MKTIFNAAKKSIRKPEFVSVGIKDGRPWYFVCYSRESRDNFREAFSASDVPVYRINVYPKNWPRIRSNWSA